MIRVVAILAWLMAGLIGPAQACGARGNSTFCADGWVAQPISRARADRRRASPGQRDDWAGDGGDPSSASGEDIYVEGAVTIGEAPVSDEEPL